MDRNQYPTLTLIDSLRSEAPHLVDSPNAAAMERAARRLVAEHWSDNVWLTGRVAAGSFHAVVSRLEHMA
jgi:hypothetical protein